jgi:hypothetical protein
MHFPELTNTQNFYETENWVFSVLASAGINEFAKKTA